MPVSPLLILAVLLAMFWPFRIHAQPPAPEGAGFEGRWVGTLDAGGLKLRLGLTLDRNPSTHALSGTLVSLDQGNAEIPLSAAQASGENLSLEAKSIGGSFQGKRSGDGGKIDGVWKQAGKTLPLSFRRTQEAVLPERPQEPKPPYPYRVEEVVFPNAKEGFNLAGTLTLPEGEGPFPAVLLVSGSGPQDRDEAIMGHRPFLVLADFLTRRGFAVLRYDDRGVGKSGGDFGSASIGDLAGDVLSALDVLAARKEIDPKRVGIFGHSEGGVLGPLAAIQAPDRVAFLILAAGIGLPIEQVLVRQAEDLAKAVGTPETLIEKNTKIQRAIFSIVTMETDSATRNEKVRSLLAGELQAMETGDVRTKSADAIWAQAQVGMITSPWFRDLLLYSPRQTLAQVRCPVLAINGEKDLQVAGKDNLDAIRAALESGGNRDVTIELFPGLNHLFQTCTTGAISEYSQIQETIAPQVLDRIASWLKQRFASSQPPSNSQ